MENSVKVSYQLIGISLKFDLHTEPISSHLLDAKGPVSVA